MQQLVFRAIGCEILAIVDCDGAQANAQLVLLPGWFEIWEQQLSRFRPTSDLSWLNASAGRVVVVRPVLCDVLACALEAAQQSDGLVVPTLLGALEAAGYDRSFSELVLEGAGVSAVLDTGDWHNITLDRRSRTVQLPAGMRLDLGGVAKGWAADQAVQ